MTGGEAAAAAAAGAVLSGIAATLVTFHRIRRAGRVRDDAEVRTVLFNALDGREVDPREIDALRPAQRRALETRACSLLPKLRGQDKESLARLLEQRGAVEAARRHSRSKRPAARVRRASSSATPVLRQPCPTCWSCSIS